MSSTKNSPDIRDKLFLSHFYSKKNINIIRILTFLFGISLFINYFFPVNTNLFSYKFVLSFPGIKSIEKTSLMNILTIMVITINSLFIISAVGSYFNEKIFNTFMAFSWAIMSIGMELWVFKWWPTPISDIPLSFEFTLFNIDFGFKINLITSFFFIWASLLIPDIRKELFKKANFK